MSLRNFLRGMVRLIIFSLLRVEVTGQENVPEQGGCVLATNHLSRVDAPLIFALVDRDDLTALVADKYQKNLFLRWMINAINGIWINRDEADFQALRAARSYLLAGGALGIAPEGTRSKTGGLTPAKTGVAYLVDKTGVPVVPIAISGTENAMQQVLRLRRPRVNVRFGEAFHLPAVDRRSRDAALQRNTDEIMCRIAALLPASYRGVYAHHPCLAEILPVVEAAVHH